MVTKKEIYDWGTSHAQGIPENNWREALDEAKSKGYDADEDTDQIKEIYLEFCHEAESISRQFSPFELTAKALNTMSKKSFEPWEVFDGAVSDYFEEFWEENEDEFWDYMYSEELDEEENNYLHETSLY